MTEEPPEGVDPEEFKKQVIAKDPFDKRMQKISEDKKIFINQKVRIKPWRIDVGYEDNIYINPYIKLLDETNLILIQMNKKIIQLISWQYA